MHTTVPRDESKLATLRGIPLKGIEAASADSVLAFGEYRKTRAWFIRDEYAGCVRRLDGKRWGNAKVLDIPGTSRLRRDGWPIGILAAKAGQSLIVCEGAPDLLAAYALREKFRADLGLVCVLGSGLTIHENALPFFAARRVRFIAHNDSAGDEFAQRNAALLAPIAAEVTIASLGGVNTAQGLQAADLCDAIANRHRFRVPDEISALFDFKRQSPAVQTIAPPRELSHSLDLVTQEDTRRTQGGLRKTHLKGRKELEMDIFDKAASLASTARGQSRKNLFDLVRSVMAFEKQEGGNSRDAIFDTWYHASRANLNPAETRAEYLAQFRRMFKKVRIVPGQCDALKEAIGRARAAIPPEIPDAPDAPSTWRLLAAVCRELQHKAGEAPFFISKRDAMRIIEKKFPMEGLRALEALEDFHVLKLVKRGEPRVGGKASEFRYLLPL